MYVRCRDGVSDWFGVVQSLQQRCARIIAVKRLRFCRTAVGVGGDGVCVGVGVGVGVGFSVGIVMVVVVCSGILLQEKGTKPKKK